MSQATAARPAPVRRAPRGTNPTATRARLKLVQPTEAASSGVGFVVLCAALLIGGLITVLLLNTARAQQQYTISDLQNASSRLSATQQDLDSQLTLARAPQQLALKAQEYGMVPATDIRYVRASDHRLVGVAKGTGSTDPFTVSTLPKTPATPVANLAVTTADLARLVEKPKAKATSQDPKKDANSSTSPSSKPSTTASAKATAPASSKAGSTTTAKTKTHTNTKTETKTETKTKTDSQKQKNTTSPSATSAR